MHEIYVIRNVRTGKRYVGHAPDLETRWILHLAAADAAYTTRRVASPLQRALLEDGPDAFCREVVARAPEAEAAAECARLATIDRAAGTGYNLPDGAETEWLENVETRGL